MRAKLCRQVQANQCNGGICFTLAESGIHIQWKKSTFVSDCEISYQKYVYFTVSSLPTDPTMNMPATIWQNYEPNSSPAFYTGIFPSRYECTVKKKHFFSGRVYLITQFLNFLPNHFLGDPLNQHRFFLLLVLFVVGGRGGERRYWRLDGRRHFAFCPFSFRRGRSELAEQETREPLHIHF